MGPGTRIITLLQAPGAILHSLALFSDLRFLSSGAVIASAICTMAHTPCLSKSPVSEMKAFTIHVSFHLTSVLLCIKMRNLTCGNGEITVNSITLVLCLFGNISLTSGWMPFAGHVNISTAARILLLCGTLLFNVA